jgi:hypothetical protein
VSWPHPCDGCGVSGDVTETLWLDAPLGMTVVHVHRRRACAESAREARGGGGFRKDGPPLSEAERALKEAASRGKR